MKTWHARALGRSVVAAAAIAAGGAGCFAPTKVSVGPMSGSGGVPSTGGGTGGGPSTGAGTGGAGGGGPLAGTGGMVGPGGGTGGGPSAGTGGAGNGSGTGGGARGTGGVGGAGMGSGTGGMPAMCQTGATFAPRAVTVYVLVDRSGSMFSCLTTSTVGGNCADQTDTAWTKLKGAALTVIGQLEQQVRFGFASFTGTNPMFGGTCPIIDKIAPAFANHDAIAALYESLPPPPISTAAGVKFEGPAKAALQLVGGELIADPSPEAKYILFVTDGQPDYCDDGNVLCAPDSVVGELQALKASGITTIIMGLQSRLFDLPPNALQAFANAGAGEPTVAPVRTGDDVNAFYDQCEGVAPWVADVKATGKTLARGVSVGAYAATAGPTAPYAPAATDQATLVSQIMQAVSGVRSCQFDLAQPQGASVDLSRLAQARVTLMGANLAMSDTNGWHMTSPTQLELTGSACSTWRALTTNDIQFSFPCSILAQP